MACQAKDHTNIGAAIEFITEKGFEGITEAMRIIFNQGMLIERSKHLQANPYERSSERLGYASGFKPKTVKTRVGALELQLPQVCDGRELLPKRLSAWNALGADPEACCS